MASDITARPYSSLPPCLSREAVVFNASRHSLKGVWLYACRKNNFTHNRVFFFLALLTAHPWLLPYSLPVHSVLHTLHALCELRMQTSFSIHFCAVFCTSWEKIAINIVRHADFKGVVLFSQINVIFLYNEKLYKFAI